jgi:hypothetical protein
MHEQVVVLQRKQSFVYSMTQYNAQVRRYTSVYQLAGRTRCIQKQPYCKTISAKYQYTNHRKLLICSYQRKLQNCKSLSCTYLRGVRLVQVLVQLLVVVDLSIDSQHDSAIMTCQWLCAALWVDDCKPLVGNAVLAIANDAVARPVRPSMSQSV